MLDPDVIEPGQELVIDIRPEQTALARAVARTLGVKAQEQTNREYLRDVH